MCDRLECEWVGTCSEDVEWREGSEATGRFIYISAVVCVRPCCKCALDDQRRGESFEPGGLSIMYISLFIEYYVCTVGIRTILLRVPAYALQRESLGFPTPPSRTPPACFSLTCLLIITAGTLLVLTAGWDDILPLQLPLWVLRIRPPSGFGAAWIPSKLSAFAYCIGPQWVEKDIHERCGS